MSDSVTVPTSAPAMADTAAPVAAPVTAPVVADTAPVTTPAAPAAPVAASAVVDPAAPAATETPAAAAPEITPHSAVPSLLDEIDGEKTESAAEPPAPVSAQYEFQFPEGFEAPAEVMTAYTTVLKDHGVSPEAGQKLLDMHTAQIRTLTENTLAAQHEAFGEMRRNWVAAVRADSEMGGPAYETARRVIARGRDMLVPESGRSEFNEFLAVTGAGDHPAFLRLLLRAGRMYDEPAVPAQGATPSPTANGARRNGSALFRR